MAEPGGLPPGRPQRKLDAVALEGLEDLLGGDGAGRGLVKSRDFSDLEFLEVQPSSVEVVLFDEYSMDSFAACFAARCALGDKARYEGVDRNSSLSELEVDVAGKVVAMVGLCWSLDALHELVREGECAWLLIFETFESSARELSQFDYPNAVRILEPGMGAAALAWNYFFPGTPVPPLLRYLEELELGRAVLRDSHAFADGFEAAFGLGPPRGELQVEDGAFEELDLLLDEGGLTTIERAVAEGQLLAGDIQAQCEEALAKYKVRTLQMFPAWWCAVLESNSPHAGRVAESLAAHLAERCGAPGRCFAVVYEMKQFSVRALLRSPPGGPDVSQVAQWFDGSGHQHRAFVSVARERWKSLWVQPEPVLWDVTPSAPQCLALAHGELVTVVKRGERFKEAPFDEWSWGYKTAEPTVEGWIPTLAHTLLVATRPLPAAGGGVRGAEEGDFLISKGQVGRFLWGWTCDRRGQCSNSPGWFPYGDGTFQPADPVHARELAGLCM